MEMRRVPQSADTVRTEESQPSFHLSDEAWLRGLLECPRLLDAVCKTSDERLRLQESLRQWQEAGYPDLKSLREGTFLSVSQQHHKSPESTSQS